MQYVFIVVSLQARKKSYSNLNKRQPKSSNKLLFILPVMTCYNVASIIRDILSDGTGGFIAVRKKYQVIQETEIIFLSSVSSGIFLKLD